MARHTRFPWGRISVGFEIVPPTLMVALGHPWLGAATLGAVLAVSGLQSWMHIRSMQERHRAILCYAQDATSMGGDPTSVIAALQRGALDTEDDALSDLPLRSRPGGPQQDRGPAGPWSHH